MTSTIRAGPGQEKLANSGGGGGSSAGTGSNGNNASGVTAGTAPTGAPREEMEVETLLTELREQHPEAGRRRR